jgi:hypothetical protein
MATLATLWKPKDKGIISLKVDHNCISGITPSMKVHHIKLITLAAVIAIQK